MYGYNSPTHAGWLWEHWSQNTIGSNHWNQSTVEIRLQGTYCPLVAWLLKAGAAPVEIQTAKLQTICPRPITDYFILNIRQNSILFSRLHGAEVNTGKKLNYNSIYKTIYLRRWAAVQVLCQQHNEVDSLPKAAVQNHPETETEPLVQELTDALGGLCYEILVMHYWWKGDIYSMFSNFLVTVFEDSAWWAVSILKHYDSIYVFRQK